MGKANMTVGEQAVAQSESDIPNRFQRALDEFNAVRVAGTPWTPREIGLLVDLLWFSTHDDIDNNEMLTRLSFVSGIVMVALLDLRKNLEGEEEDG